MKLYTKPVLKTFNMATEESIAAFSSQLSDFSAYESWVTSYDMSSTFSVGGGA